MQARWGEMSVGLRNYWDVWLTIADAGVPWAAVGWCLRLGQPSWAVAASEHQAKQSLSMVLHTAASDRGHAAQCMQRLKRVRCG